MSKFQGSIGPYFISKDANFISIGCQSFPKELVDYVKTNKDKKWSKKTYQDRFGRTKFLRKNKLSYSVFLRYSWGTTAWAGSLTLSDVDTVLEILEKN